MGGERKRRTDVVFVHAKTGDGTRARVLRLREDRVEVGELGPVKEGHEIKGEMVKLKPRPEHERLFDVEVVAPTEEASEPATATAASSSGPAQVASEAYRAHWEEIFGKPARSKTWAKLMN